MTRRQRWEPPFGVVRVRRPREDEGRVVFSCTLFVELENGDVVMIPGFPIAIADNHEGRVVQREQKK